jgi:hypothetical protein
MILCFKIIEFREHLPIANFHAGLLLGHPLPQSTRSAAVKVAGVAMARDRILMASG